MQETVEFRIPEEYADLLFRADEGRVLGGTIRSVSISSSDPRFNEIDRINREIYSTSHQKTRFFYGWIISRRYSKVELDNASLFRCKIVRAFEPSAEECGTIYDDSAACPHCGSGAPQTGPLRLRLSSIPKSVDIAKTIAGEMVVSKRIVELFTAKMVSGVQFDPVLTKNGRIPTESEWFQLTGTNRDVDVVPPTRAGEDPFDQDERFKCSRNDLIGMHLLTEVSVDARTRGSEDVVYSRQYVGLRTGLLRPERIMLVSPRVRSLVLKEKLKGFEFEVAHLV